MSSKKRTVSQRTKSGPALPALIVKVISVSTERSGVSLVALKKALKAEGYDVAKNNTRILSSVRCLVARKILVRTKGTGASGSFKLNKKAPAPRKKRVVKKRKPKVKKFKRASAKKANETSDVVRTSPKKKRKVKSPKKSAAAKPKMPRSPKMTKVRRSARTRAAAKK